MKIAIVTLSELQKGNARLCLSAKRALKRCWQCKLYPTCESKIVNRDYEVDMQKVKKLTLEHKKEIRAIKVRWDVQ